MEQSILTELTVPKMAYYCRCVGATDSTKQLSIDESPIEIWQRIPVNEAISLCRKDLLDFITTSAWDNFRLKETIYHNVAQSAGCSSLYIRAAIIHELIQKI